MAQSDLDFRKLDDFTEARSLVTRINEILVEGRSHNVETFDQAYWEWQYKNLPIESRVYVCTSAGENVGYYHVPIYKGVIDNEPKRFAMVQDVAVSSKMRGRGVFRKLAEFATNDLLASSGVGLIYTFPNQRSAHTFVKYNGYAEIFSLDTFILPIEATAIIRSKFSFYGVERLLGWGADKFCNFRDIPLRAGQKVLRLDSFDDQVISLFENFGERFRIHLDRSREYMNWRFFAKPRSDHFLFALRDEDNLLAVAVFKLDRILDTKTAVLMDFAYRSELDLVRIAHYVRKNSQQLFNEPVGMIYTSFCCGDLLKHRSYGFIRVPQRINPRPLKLFVKNVSESEELVLDPSHWLVLLSDWDVL